MIVMEFKFNLPNLYLNRAAEILLRCAFISNKLHSLSVTCLFVVVVQSNSVNARRNIPSCLPSIEQHHNVALN